MCKNIVNGLLGIILMVAVVACTSNASDSIEVDSQDLRVQNASTLVETQKAVKKPFIFEINSNGQVISSQETSLTFKVPGVVESLNVQEGDFVKKGQLLVKLNNDELALTLEQVKIKLKESELEYQNRILATGNRGDTLQRVILHENLAYITGLRSAEIALRKAELEFNSTLIRAPFNGVISNIEISNGAQVKQGDKLAIISNTSSLKVKAEVLESVIGKIKVGQKAQLEPLALDKTYTAVVSTINPRVAENGMIKLGLNIISSNGLMPGMHVAVFIRVPYHNHIVIPETAVVVRSGKEVVFVEEDGLAKWKYVTTGLKSNKEVEVLEGLTIGDNVITTNAIYLAHDAPVKTIMKN